MGVAGRGRRQGRADTRDPHRALQAGIGGCITCASSRQNRLCDLLGPAFSSGNISVAIFTTAIFTSPIFAAFPENPRLAPHIRQSLKRETSNTAPRSVIRVFSIE